MTVRSAGEYSSQHSVETAEETTSQGHGYAHQGDVPQVLRFHPVEATNRSGCSSLSLSLSLSLSPFLTPGDLSGILKSRTHTPTHVFVYDSRWHGDDKGLVLVCFACFSEGEGFRSIVVETLRVGTCSADGTRISGFH